MEALRLGCEAYALELNPVAHIIELCTLVYPQKYGKPDPTVPGMTGPPLQTAHGTPVAPTLSPSHAPRRSWGGLAKEVEYWGKWVLEQVRREIGDLYPPIPDPDYKGKRPEIEFDRETGYWVEKTVERESMERGSEGTGRGAKERESVERESGQGTLAGLQDASLSHAPTLSRSASPTPPRGYLTPVAYLWTRTVKCKNPNCGATVPLVRQTWLCKKPKRYVALKMIAPKGAKQVRFEVVEATSEKGLGFDPAAFSKGGNATCPFCGTVADDEYIRTEGCAERTGMQLMAVACLRPGRQGKVYLSPDYALRQVMPDETRIRERTEGLCSIHELTIPDEPINPLRPSPWTRGASGVTRHGLVRWGDLFTSRQTLCLLTFASLVRKAHSAMMTDGIGGERGTALAAYLALLVDRVAEYSGVLTRWDNTQQRVVGLFGRQALPMVWDFPELVPIERAVGGWLPMLEAGVEMLQAFPSDGISPQATRGTATELAYTDGLLDAVVTDPPYYDNIPYADISDFFYVWLKRTIGHLFLEHFGSEITPKKAEVTALSSRHAGDMAAAKAEYKSMMARAFCQAQRVLKPGAPLICVYAHKTTAGWATLVDALQEAGFIVTEAWPLDTEQKQRLLGMGTAALASSIFLVARKRDGAGAGSYERDVRPELESIVRERVDTLWKMGISGADLVIAAVGAGLRAYTQFERVAYENGEEVPAERFLSEVEGVVLDTLLERIFGVSKSGVSAVDAPTRFYVLWRFTYRQAEIDAGEAIVFAYPQGVELDGPRSLTYGSRALLEKRKSKYRLRDFTERGDDERLGLAAEDGAPAPLIDVLHRVLWLMENRPAKLFEFLGQAVPDTERMRLVAQALAGPALEGGADLGMARNPEQAALRKLTTNWRSLIEDNLFRARG